MMKDMTAALKIAAMTLALPALAAASTISLSLLNPTQSTLPGSTLSFVATVSAPGTNTGAVFLNGDSSSVDFPLTLFDDGFFFGFPLSLDPGHSFTGELFTVAVPSFAASGTAYHGFFEIDGGADGGALDALASVNFEVDTAPEPGSAVLVVTGLFGLVVAVRRKGVE